MGESDELRRLRSENDALNEQIKLLVRTEQRLHRSQTELDLQLARIRALGQFSLDCTRLDTSAEILERARELLLESFHLDGGCTRQFDDGSGHALDPREPLLLRGGDFPQPFAQLLEAEGVVEAVGLLVCLPVHIGGDRLAGAVLGWRLASTRHSYHQQDLEERHLPFLALLASHLGRAVQNAQLTADLSGERRQLAASLSELERTQQQLVQAQKMEAVGRLAGGVAHDFNNLLTVIINHAEILRASLPPDSSGQAHVNSIGEASDRAANITRQLLAFSRREPQRREVLDLNALTAGTAEMLERFLGERVTLELELSAGGVHVRADRSQLEQILLNLVVNARDAMPEGGTVSISTRSASAEDVLGLDGSPDPRRLIALSVGDTGAGMDDTTRSQIFDPFFTTKEVGHGTGLGLAMVYGAVQQSRGHITVKTEPGTGSVFTVLLPLAEGAPAAEGSPDEALPAEGGATVLLVEDEPDVLEVGARVLEQRGFRVFEARDGETALELARAHGGEIDVLVTDIVMPDLGGVALARLLREERPGLPVVYVSGYPFEHLDVEAMADNQALLQKPFTGESLARAVARVLARVGA